VPYIEIKKTGICSHGLKVDVDGNQINSRTVGHGELVSMEMAQSPGSFVRG